MKKTVLKIILGALAVAVAAVLIYVAYVMLTYYRVEDQTVLPISQPEQPVVAETGKTYRAVSYNIGFGAYSPDYSFFMDGGRESRARSPEAVYENVGGAIQEMQSLSPDFLLLQEVDVDGTRSHHIDQRQMVLDAMGKTYSSTCAQNYDSPYLFWPLSEPHGANQAGQVTLSRYTVAEAVRRSLPIERGFMKFLDLDRCYAVHRIPLSNGRELVLYNFHLSAYTSDGTIAEAQLEMLFADMLTEYEKGNYAIAGGDFNKDLLGDSAAVFGVSGEEYTWAQPIPPEIIPAGLAVVAPFDEGMPVPSCRNADRPYGPDNFVLVVDGFIVTDNVSVVESKVVDAGFRWSDHNPVYMDVILQENVS